jgi:ABC-2 type transport system permease protein
VFFLACVGLPVLVVGQLFIIDAFFRGEPRAQPSPSAPASATASQASIDAAITRLVPTGVMLLVFATVAMTSGMLLRTVGDEKTNRVLEILLTSVHPRQLLSVKIVALGVAGLLQAVAWVGLTYLLLVVSGKTADLPFGSGLRPAVLAWGTVFALLGYAVYASLFAGAGALVPDWRRSPQVSLLLSLPMLAAFYVGLMTDENPHGLVAVVASLFPPTAPFVMVRRLAVGGVPSWQIWLAAGLTLLTVWAIVRAVARMFQAQNLLAGQPFSLQRYLRLLLGAS